MMLYPSVGELIEGEKKCRYSLVIAVAKRARDIAHRAEMEDEKLEEKPITLAIESFADGEADFHESDKPIDKE